MTKPQSAARPKRARSSEGTGRKVTQNAQTTASTLTISDDQRRAMIAEAAYFRAAQRGFNGDAVADWLASEREVDALLASSSD